MITNEEIKERIDYYMSFFSGITDFMNLGCVRKSQLSHLATQYGLNDEVFDALIETGYLMAFDITDSLSAPVSVNRFHPESLYIISWNEKPTENIAFRFHLGIEFDKQLEAYDNYCLFKHFEADNTAFCLYCQTPFKNENSIHGYCSSKCFESSINASSAQGKSHNSKGDALERFFDLVIDLLHEFKTSKNKGHGKR